MPQTDFLAGAKPVQGADADFLANAKPVTVDLTTNPNGQGTYRMVGPKGLVQIPYGNVDTAKQQGFKFATQDDLSRYDKDAGTSLWQRAKDNFNYNTQGAPPSDNPVKAAVENFGAGGADQLRSLANPGQIVNGIIQTAAHPIDTAKGMAASAMQNPARFAGNVGMGLLTGEGAGAAADAASGVVGSLAPKIVPDSLPERLYGSALKPSTTLTPAERSAVIQTGLENNLPVSEKGLTNLHNRINALNDNIKQVIAADPTRTIDPQAVAARVDQIRPSVAAQVNAGRDLNDIEASKQQFLREQGATPGQPATPPQPTGLLDAQGNPIMSAGTPAMPPQPAPPMSAADAQAMKQGTYQSLGGKAYGELKSANIQAQKALARGLKEEIANQFPEISNLNAQESRLLDLQPLLEKAVSREANHQLLGIGTPIAGAAGEAMTGSTPAGAAIAALKMAVDSPMIKSRIAIALSKGAKIPYSQAAARVAAYSSALGASADATQASPPDQTGSGPAK